jgi:hypothetical protein
MFKHQTTSHKSADFNRIAWYTKPISSTATFRLQARVEIGETSRLSGKSSASLDTAKTQVHKQSDTVVAAFEGLTLGESAVDESGHMQALQVRESEDRAEAKRTQTKRHPSVTRMPHVIAVSVGIHIHSYQGCQIIRGATYQKWKKCTK